MKTKPARPMRLVEEGKTEWEHTDEYRRSVRKLVDAVTAQYSTTIQNEKSWIRGLLIKLRREIEIARQIDALSSSRNLHAIGATPSIIPNAFTRQALFAMELWALRKQVPG